MVSLMFKYHFVISSKVIRFLLVLLVGTFLRLDSHVAATYYIAPEGNDQYVGTRARPFGTFSRAFHVMSPGDLLIVRNGTYFQRIYDPPSGKENGYTIIRAEHDGKAILDGRKGMPYPGAVVVIGPNQSRIRLEGLKLINGGERVVSIEGSRIEIKRSAVSGADTNNAYAEGITLYGSHNLLEDVWVWGPARYLIDVGGSNQTVRRVIVRFDSYSNGSRPVAGLALYDARESIIENFVALDFNPPPNPNQAWGAIYGKGNAEKNRILGAITLNIVDFMSAYWLAEWAGGSIFNSVAWDTSGIGLRFGTKGGVADRITLGKNKAAVLMNENAILSNSILVEAGSIQGTGQIEYDLFFETPIARNSLHFLNKDPKLKYIARIEEQSPAFHSGANGKNRGATILFRYLNGVETTQPLWPWPFEDRIHADMCEVTNRGFCSKPSLSHYIWEYLNSPCPVGLCNSNLTKKGHSR